jgi:hypothetical protein
MMLPKVSEAVAENVQIQAMRNLVEYMKNKSVTVAKENPFLAAAIDGMAKEISEGDDHLYKRVYLSMLVIADIINTQMEVDDLKFWN